MKKSPVNAEEFLSKIKPANSAEHYLKKFSIPLIFTLFIIFFWWSWATGPVEKNNKTEKIFIIQKGENTDEIIDDLFKEKFIRSKLAFKIILKKENLSDRIQAGDFRLSQSNNSFQIARSLTHGMQDVWITLPEGLRREEIYQILTKNGFRLDYNSWQEQTLLEEGYLFPDTYSISKDASITAIVKMMKDNFNKKTQSLSGKVGKKEVILASLIEREVKNDKDRPIVAGILVKRLENGWPLEIDATIQYALASQVCQPNGDKGESKIRCWWPNVTSNDLKINSPYNTRIKNNLPPSPICNPGLLSLKAVLSPVETNYWFYLSDKGGNIYFAKTLEDQEANIKRYIKEET